MKLLVIDIGNTRTKWALADSGGKLSEVTTCFNADIATSSLPQDAVKTQKVIIANVAAESVAHQITQLLQALGKEFHFVTAKVQACGVMNGYQKPHTLGADRWAALVAAWHIYHQAVIVVNAGTAITIDALIEDTTNDSSGENGLFLGGTIMPGLRLMHESLSHHAAQLNMTSGSMDVFPANTQDAMQTGCLNAVAGAIHLMLERLERQCGSAPKLVMSGGDAHKIAQALNLDAKQVIIIENLVLQGLVLLEKEF